MGKHYIIVGFHHFQETPLKHKIQAALSSSELAFKLKKLKKLTGVRTAIPMHALPETYYPAQEGPCILE